MSVVAKIVEFAEIPLEKLQIGTSQVRLSEVGKDINELAESIRKQGLLEPILVAPIGDDRYEIVLGQRRFLAHQSLGLKTIRAGILSETVDEATAKVISVTENLVRRDLNRKDLIDVCTYLYKKYGSVGDVSRETGLPYGRVSQYVKYDRLMPELKKLVDSGQANLQAALRAQDAATVTGGDSNPNDAVRLAVEMSGMSGAQQKKIVADRKSDPDIDVDDAIEHAKSGGKITQIVVTLGVGAHGALTRFAGDEGSNLDDAALSLIEEGLTTKGYYESQS